MKSESEVAQSYPTLCDPMDCSLPGSSVHGISQARVLEWVAIAFSISSLHQVAIFWIFFFFQHSTGASISVLPMNIQGCAFKIDCLNLLAVRDSQVFSPVPQYESINSLVLSLLNGLTLTFIHDYWKNHSLNYIDLHW